METIWNCCSAEEAKKKWCPAGMVAMPGGSSCNREPNSSDICLCLADDCMGWKWADLDETQGFCVYCRTGEKP